LKLTHYPKFHVLYIGSLGPISTSTHRCRAIERLGHRVSEFDTDPYLASGLPLLRKIRNRTLIGRSVARFNRDLLAKADADRPDLIWFEKAVYLYPKTLRALRALGIYTLSFNIDNPFGPRRDPGRRLLLATIPEFDLHLVQREINLVDYRRAGARDVILMRTAYEPTVHFPPPAGWSDVDRRYDVVFIGSCYDNRAEFLTQLAMRHGVPLTIWGDHWQRAMSASAQAALWRGPAIYNDSYRETMWRSRICLSFVTHSNRDDVAHKSFEIAACGAFLLAEDTPGHQAHFIANHEAVFFRDVDEGVAQIRRFLPNEAARAEIATAGRRRAESSGYSNDARIAGVFEYLVKKFSRR